jgi:hypothetical protein
MYHLLRRTLPWRDRRRMKRNFFFFFEGGERVGMREGGRKGEEKRG